MLEKMVYFEQSNCKNTHFPKHIHKNKDIYSKLEVGNILNNYLTTVGGDLASKITESKTHFWSNLKRSKAFVTVDLHILFNLLNLLSC